MSSSFYPSKEAHILDAASREFRKKDIGCHRDSSFLTNKKGDPSEQIYLHKRTVTMVLKEENKKSRVINRPLD